MYEVFFWKIYCNVSHRDKKQVPVLSLGEGRAMEVASYPTCCEHEQMC